MGSEQGDNRASESKWPESRLAHSIGRRGWNGVKPKYQNSTGFDFNAGKMDHMIHLLLVEAVCMGLLQ